MSNIYNWEIKSVSTNSNTMIVSYGKIGSDKTYEFNITKPLIGVDLTEHIQRHAPVAMWTIEATEYQEPLIDQVGTGTFEIMQGYPAGIDAVSNEDALLQVAIQRVLAEMAAGTV